VQSRQGKEAIRVAFVTDLLSIGGAETQLVSLVKALDPGRIDARVAVLRADGTRPETLAAAAPDTKGVRVIGMRGATDPRTLPTLASWIRRGRFRAVYTTHLWSLVYSALVKEWMTPPVPQQRLVLVASEHSYRMRTASRGSLVALRRWALRRADRIIAVAQAQADWLREYYGPKAGPIEVIPNGIDPSRFAGPFDGGAVRAEFGIPDGTPTVVCVARLVPVKGIEILLSAMQVPVLQEKGAHLILVGDGPNESALRERAQAQGLAGRVHFAGRQVDPRPFLAAADVACLPSFSEAQPIALLEAMAAGRAIVASAVGGIPEMIGHDEPAGFPVRPDESAGVAPRPDESAGLLVRPGDPADLARALARALADREWRERAGKRGRERVERVFSIQERARRIEGLIEELAGR